MLFPSVLSKLRSKSQEGFLLRLFQLIAEDIFPFSSICFVLFFGILALALTTFIFWDALFQRFKRILVDWEMLFGGKFIRFMQGFKHKGLVTSGKAEKGYYDHIAMYFAFMPSQIMYSLKCGPTS